jgi:hypothetical protein
MLAARSVGVTLGVEGRLHAKAACPLAISLGVRRMQPWHAERSHGALQPDPRV